MSIRIWMVTKGIVRPLILSMSSLSTSTSKLPRDYIPTASLDHPSKTMEHPIWHHCHQKAVDDPAHFDKGQQGVFLTDANVKAGTLLIDENVLFSFTDWKYEMDDPSEPYMATSAMMIFISDYTHRVNSEHGDEFCREFDNLHYHEIDKTHYKVALSQIVAKDSQHHIERMAKGLAIVEANAMRGQHGSYVVLAGYDRLNHSCSPSVFLQQLNKKYCTHLLGDAQSFAALAQHQVFTSYLTNEELCRSAQERQAILQRGWHFQCSCEACSHPKVSDPRRKIMRKWVSQFSGYTNPEEYHPFQAFHEAQYKDHLKIVSEALKAAKDEKLFTNVPAILYSKAIIQLKWASRMQADFEFDKALELFELVAHSQNEAQQANSLYFGTHFTRANEAWRQSLANQYHKHEKGIWSGNAVANWHQAMLHCLFSLKPTEDNLQQALVAVDALLDWGPLPNVFDRRCQMEIAYSGAACCLLAAKATSDIKQHAQLSARSEVYVAKARQIAAASKDPLPKAPRVFQAKFEGLEREKAQANPQH